MTLKTIMLHFVLIISLLPRVFGQQKSHLGTLTAYKNWSDYTDTIKGNFIIKFKYPNRFVAEGIQNGRCIGKPRKVKDNDQTNTMDCCIWLNDTTDIKGKPIDSLILWETKYLNTLSVTTKDSINIAKARGIKVTVCDAKNKTRILKQMVYFIKFGTFIEIINSRLSKNEFSWFINSMEIEK